MMVVPVRVTICREMTPAPSVPSCIGGPVGTVTTGQCVMPGAGSRMMVPLSTPRGMVRCVVRTPMFRVGVPSVSPLRKCGRQTVAAANGEGGNAAD